MVNAGAAAVGAELLLFLNNDTEVVSGEWIQAMVEHGQRPGVGAVGARLVYPDGHPQHEGIVIGAGGVAGNVDTRDYFGLGRCVRNCSAVTAACMLTRADVFHAVGGFDENLPVAFNDVDYCLKLRDKGYLVVYTPYAVLYHHEGESRGRMHPEHDERLCAERWRIADYRDPYYNPNLSLEHPFTLRINVAA